MRTKKPIYMRYKQACGIWGHRKSSYKRAPNYTVSKKRVRWSWKVTSVWIKHARNGRVNFVQDLVLIHCPHSSGCCWLPYNVFVGILWLPLERLCTLLHKCWPKQRSIQLEIRGRLSCTGLRWWRTKEPLLFWLGLGNRVLSDRQNTTHNWARDNVKHDLESLLEQIDFSSFLSLARIITFSPPRTRSKPPSLEAFYYIPPFTL